jgi:hypothetical protein
MTKTTVLLKYQNLHMREESSLHPLLLGFVLSLEFCYKDLWFGAYWEKNSEVFDLYFGIPFLVVHLRRYFKRY